MKINELLNYYLNNGLTLELAEARVCQDIILKCISNSSLSQNVTIKGGIIMRSITKDIRRSTRDIDFDFIKYSIADESIKVFIDKLNFQNEFKIEIDGDIEELKHQDYHGKCINIKITDNDNNVLKSKIDIGVHSHYNIVQENYCFDIALDDKGATLLMNSLEQTFTEKLKSLLIFGPNSTRYKDVYDMYYLIDFLNKNKLLNIIDILIINNKLVHENTYNEIYTRVKSTFENDMYIKHLSNARQKWLEIDTSIITDKIINFLKNLL